MSQLLMRRPNLDCLPEIAPPPGLLLRRYQPGDIPKLAVLLADAFNDSTWTDQQVMEALILPPDVKQVFVFEDITDGNGTLAATASARLQPENYPGSGYVHWVGVGTDYRGRQLGTLASLAVLQEFVRLGASDAVLETDDTRLAAIQTYRGLGFEPVHRNKTHAARWTAVFQEMERKREN